MSKTIAKFKEKIAKMTKQQARAALMVIADGKSLYEALRVASTYVDDIEALERPR